MNYIKANNCCEKCHRKGINEIVDGVHKMRPEQCINPMCECHVQKASNNMTLQNVISEQKKEIAEDILMDLCEPDTGLIAIGKHDHDALREAFTTAFTKGYELALEEVSDYLKKEMPSDFNAVKLINYLAHLKETNTK